MKSLAEKLLPFEFRNKLQRILDQNNAYRAVRKKGVCSTHTQYDRTTIIRMAFAQLWAMGWRLPSPRTNTTG